MSEAPERIWAFYTPDDFDDTATITAYETVQHGAPEYRRADLPPTLSAAMELPEVRALVAAATTLMGDFRSHKFNSMGDYYDPGKDQQFASILTALAPFTEATP